MILLKTILKTQITFFYNFDFVEFFKYYFESESDYKCYYDDEAGIFILSTEINYNTETGFLPVCLATATFKLFFLE